MWNVIGGVVGSLVFVDVGDCLMSRYLGFGSYQVVCRRSVNGKLFVLFGMFDCGWYLCY